MGWFSQLRYDLLNPHPIACDTERFELHLIILLFESVHSLPWLEHELMIQGNEVESPGTTPLFNLPPPHFFVKHASAWLVYVFVFFSFPAFGPPPSPRLGLYSLLSVTGI